MSPIYRRFGDGSVITDAPVDPRRLPMHPVVHGRWGRAEHDESAVPVTDGNPAPSGHSPSAASISERYFTMSTSVLDSVIPMVYGERKVAGLCAFRQPYFGNRYINLGYIFCFGEQDSIDKIWINDEEVYPSNQCGNWVTQVSVYTGDGSSAISAMLTAVLSADEQAQWKLYTHCTLRLNLQEGDVPGSLTVTALLGGRLIDCSWRGGSASLASNNLADVAYDICTAEAWKGLSASLLDTAADGTWRQFYSFCADAMGDASARWSFNGRVDQRDPDAALADVLGHGFGELYVDADGKLKIRADMMPPKITGTWSASGTTVTEDTSSGAALTDLAAGDIVYIGTAVRTVASVTNDDTFVLTASLTAAAQAVRKTSGVYLRLEDWVKVPEGHDKETSAIPDKVLVRYAYAEDLWGSAQYPKVGDLGPTDDKLLEITLSGCTNASMARRYSETYRSLMALEVFEWDGLAGAAAASLEPGDVFFFDDDVLTMQAARVLPPVEWRPDGTYVLHCREFDPSCYSENTQADDTPPALDPQWTTGPPDEPTSCTQAFGYGGDWVNAGVLPAYPDDLTNALWTETDDVTLTYNGTEVATEIYNPGTGDDYSHVGAGWTPPTGVDYVFLTCLIKLKENEDAGQHWALWVTTHAASVAYQEMDPTSEWRRVWMVCPVTPGTHYHLSVYGHYGGTPPLSRQEKIYVKRFMAIPWTLNPEYSMFERWTWVEDADADETVRSYQAYIETPSGQPIVLAEVPQGVTSIEFPVVLSGGMMPSRAPTYSGGYYDYDMRALGINGATQVFPAPTQSISNRGFSLQLTALADINQTSKSTGSVPYYDGTEFVMKPGALLSASGVNTNSDNLDLANAKHVRGKTAGGTATSMVGMNSSDEVELRAGVAKVLSDRVRIGNYAGGNYTDIPSADGDIHQYGTAVLTNVTRAETPEFRGKLWNTTLEKALTDNSAVNLFQWDSSDADSAGFLIHYEVKVVYTVIAVTRYLIETGLVIARMVNSSGTVTVSTPTQLGNGQTNTGTGTMTVTFGTGTGSNYGRVNVTCDLTSGTWVSGEVRYQVMTTDTDYNALSLFG